MKFKFYKIIKCNIIFCFLYLKKRSLQSYKELLQYRRTTKYSCCRCFLHPPDQPSIHLPTYPIHIFMATPIHSVTNPPTHTYIHLSSHPSIIIHSSSIYWTTHASCMHSFIYSPIYLPMNASIHHSFRHPSIYCIIIFTNKLLKFLFDEVEIIPEKPGSHRIRKHIGINVS